MGEVGKGIGRVIGELLELPMRSLQTSNERMDSVGVRLTSPILTDTNRNIVIKQGGTPWLSREKDPLLPPCAHIGVGVPHNFSSTFLRRC